ncbi:MAG: hypothetical protein ACE5HA_05255 [Anaerolineae bacterium]
MTPAISVTKTADPTSVPEPGGSVAFTVRVTNTGPEAVTLNSLVDDVYGDLNGKGTCSVPQSIAVAASYACSFTAQLTGNAGYTETDTVTATAADDQGNTARASDNATVVIIDVPPVIAVVKTANPGSLPEPGGNVTFTVHVTNNSIETVTLNSLVDDIHGDLNGQGACSVPQSIAVGAAYECTFTAQVAGNAGHSEIDTVTAAATDDEGNTAQDSDSATVIVTDVPPSIGVSKTANPGSVMEPGGTVSFSVRVTNNGVEAVTLNSLIDDVYGDLNGQGSCSVPQSIAVGGFYECSFDGQVTGNAGDRQTDTVTATASDDEGNTVSAFDRATVTITDAPIRVAIEKTANPNSMPEPGGNVTFTVRLTNNGVENVTLNSLVDDIHGNLDGRGSCSVPQTIVVGGSYVCAFTAQVTGNAGYTEIDTVTANLSDDEGNTVEVSDSATVIITDVPPTVAVSKTANPSSRPEPGGSVTFTVRVTNTSIEAVTLNSLVDDVYGDLNGKGTCSVPQTLAVGASYECSFSAQVTGNAGHTETDTVTATVTDDEGNAADASDSATVIITDVPPTVQVNKTADPGSMREPGGNVTFTVRVTNTSVETVTLNSLKDDVHGNLNGRGTCSVPQTLAVGASYECSFTADVTGNAGHSETDTVTARVMDDEGNTAQASDSATVRITGGPSGCSDGASLTIRKYHDMNGNGTRDGTEPYLPGWIFRITFDGQVFDVVTDETGTATLGGLREGQRVTIEERLDLQTDEDWLSTTGNPVQTTLACGENVLRFGNAHGGPPKTGRGGGYPPGAGFPSPWTWAGVLAGVAVFLALLAKARHSATLLAAGRGALLQHDGRLGWLLLPLVLLAAAIRRLTRKYR